MSTVEHCNEPAYDHLFKILIRSDYHENRLQTGNLKSNYSFDLDGKQMKLDISWNTVEGPFGTIGARPYSGLDGVFFVYDHRNACSLVRARRWLDKIDRWASSSICKLLVGINLEKSGGRINDHNMAKEFADLHQIPYLEATYNEYESDMELELAYEKLVDDIYWNMLEKQKKDREVGLKSSVQNHLSVETNALYERLVFHTMERIDGENIAQYCTRLMKQAQCCKFEESMLEEQVRDRILASCRSSKMTERFIKEGVELTLKSLLEIGASIESE